MLNAFFQMIQGGEQSGGVNNTRSNFLDVDTQQHGGQAFKWNGQQEKFSILIHYHARFSR